MLRAALEQLRHAVTAAGTGAPPALDPTRSGVQGADQSWVRL